MQTMRLEPMTGCGILGVLKCVAGMKGVLPLIHGPLSCSSGHRLAMLYAGVEPCLPTTCVTESALVSGSADRLEKAMDLAYQTYHPPLIVVILTCATAMTAEDFQPVLKRYEQRTGAKALLADGSALTGDEVDACPALYEAIGDALGEKAPVQNNLVALDGLAMTDYGFEAHFSALKQIVEGGLNAQFVPGMFAGADVFNPSDAYHRAKRLPVSLLWERDGLRGCAPFGAAGTMRFLSWAGQRLGLPVQEKAAACAKETMEKLAALRPSVEGLRVGIEGAGWYAYALADFLRNELGARVLLCVDRAAPSIDAACLSDEFYEDTGRYELTELLTGFGAQVVFGSSNVQWDEKWRYQPFFQPVWRVVPKLQETLGFEGALRLAASLAEAE